MTSDMQNLPELPDTAELEEAVRRDRYYHRFRNMVTSTFLTLVVVAAVAVLVAVLFLPVLRIYGKSMITSASAVHSLKEGTQTPSAGIMGSTPAVISQPASRSAQVRTAWGLSLCPPQICGTMCMLWYPPVPQRNRMLYES